ncbi:ATP-binding protein [Streptomyces sp. NPDC048428]|uniref:ATP-binding protein n=1 Tax=Streptomyces sp. NPDC048428 TaxID=3154503 RepID=UPI0034480E0B
MTGVPLRAATPGARPPRRSFAREALVDWACGVDVDDVLLCVSELAINALVHGVPPGRGFRLHLCWERGGGGRLRVEMHDSGDGEVPTGRHSEPGPDAEGGRGLLLVSALADAWGAVERSPGKVVWCEFAASARMFAGTEPGAHHLP